MTKFLTILKYLDEYNVKKLYTRIFTFQRDKESRERGTFKTLLTLYPISLVCLSLGIMSVVELNHL